VELTSPSDADYQTAFRARHAQLGIWLAAGGYLTCALRLALADHRMLSAAFALGGALLTLCCLALPLRDLLEHRFADRAWSAAITAQWILLALLVAPDPDLLSIYPVAAALLVVYASIVFSARLVIWIGGLVVLAYPVLTLGQRPRDLLLIGMATTMQAVSVALGAGAARHRTWRESRRRWAERRGEALLEQSSDALLAIDQDGIIGYQSPSTSTLLGHQRGTLTGVDVVDLFHPGDQRSAEHWLRLLLTASAGHQAVLEARIRTSDRGWCQAEILGVNRLGEPDLDAVILNISDVGTRKDLEARLARQAFRDALTGLANRALLRDRVRHAVDRGRRSASTIALLLIDLDGFKLINDTVGHAKGDELLVIIAQRLTGYIRPSDTLARLGGDEFALLIEDRIDETTAVALGGRLLEAVRQPVTLDGRDVVVTASIGIAVTRAGVVGAKDAEELLRNADLAVYAAKAAGRDQAVLFDPKTHVEVLRETEHRADLESAFANDQFLVRYQPIVDLPTLRMVGVEALVRWRHPEKGIIGPSDFIPLAESTGLIVPLGRWVLHMACSQVMEWQRSLPGARTLRVSVNLSARQFQYPDLVDDVAAILKSTGIDPHQVVLEITESLLMLDTDATVATLHQLKDLGVRLAIDDFGTGYSSLSYLRRFPVDIIKIDRSFVDGLTTGTTDSALTEAVVQLGRSLRLQTIAEGIETVEQSARLTELGCDFGQGFLFAKPVQASDIEPMLNFTSG
jgi:diguanylate cyclase (GGDEF)-like protein/PAS domain S-box-containing protein